MTPMPRPPVERTADGFVLHLDDGERSLLSRLLGDLRGLIGSEADNPALRRLFPVAYHLDADADADAEYQRLMRDELVSSRLAAMTAVEEALTAGRFQAGDATAFIQSVNSLRLVLGTLLDVDEEHEIDDVDGDDPQAPEHHLYAFLSWLLDWTVRAMS